MYLTCKNTSIKPDRNWLMTRGEKQCEGILSMSLLEATYPSEPRGYLSWKIATTVRWKMKHDMEDLGLSLFPSQKKKGRYVTVISRDIRMYCGRFVGPSHTVHGWSPCSLNWRRQNQEIYRKKRFYICSDGSHTHTPSRRRVEKLRSGQWNENE